MTVKKKVVGFTYGANQSKKEFTLKGKPNLAGSRNLITKISQQAVVREPRSFADDAKLQSQRHLATAVGSYLKSKGDTQFQEIQVGRFKKSLLISSNHNTSNKTLNDLVSKLDTASFIAEVTKENPNDSEREKRHKVKLAQRWKRTLRGNNSLAVTEAVPSKLNGLHAERRIEKAGGTHIIGIKRMCAHCYDTLAPEDDDDRVSEGPGPAWQSGAASLDGAKASTHVTRITKIRRGDGKAAFTVEFGTESDTDAESAASSKKRTKTSILGKRSSADSDSDEEIVASSKKIAKRSISRGRDSVGSVSESESDVETTKKSKKLAKRSLSSRANGVDSGLESDSDVEIAEPSSKRTKRSISRKNK